MSDGQQESRAVRVRGWIQFGVLVFATVWGAYTFILKDIVRPARRPTALDLTVGLEEVGRTPTHRLIRLRVARLNPTDRRLYMLDEWYTVWGHKVVRRDSASFRSEVEVAPRLTVTARHSTVRTEVVASGRIVTGDATDGFHWYDPHDKSTYEAVFAVPGQQYDFLTVRAEYYYASDTVNAGPSRWELADDASWFPIPTIRSRGGDSLEAFDPDHNPRHVEWARANAAAHNSSLATLSLWPGPR